MNQCCKEAVVFYMNYFTKLNHCALMVRGARQWAAGIHYPKSFSGSSSGIPNSSISRGSKGSVLRC